MFFEKYKSIENHYNVKQLERIHRLVPAEAEWTMLEKADGANFSVTGLRTADGIKVEFAKRSGPIVAADSTGFFDFEIIREDLILKMHQLMSNYPTTQQVTVF